jgi:chromosome partitioning protein
LGKVIAIANQKGGVGKTTTAISLGAALAKQDMWTLVMDCDPQANTTGGLGFPRDPARRSLHHALMHGVPLKEVVLNTGVEGLHLIPSEKNLVGASVELVEVPEREQVLRRKMAAMRWVCRLWPIASCPLSSASRSEPLILRCGRDPGYANQLGAIRIAPSAYRSIALS